MFELVPLSRINSHVEPFIGDLVARQAGVYSLVFDNTYSRYFMEGILVVFCLDFKLVANELRKHYSVFRTVI